MVEAGRVLADRYVLEERLSRGGTAEVFRGTDRVLHRGVAVKVLAPELASDRSFLTRFEHEARAAASLNHPNVVAVYDTGADGDERFIVMELVDGPTLAEVIADAAPLHADRAVEIAVQVCSALEAAHDQGLVHRDIKPANVMFTPTGTVKVTDFGIARAIATATRTATVYGSAPYMAPEQAKGESVDGRTDVYALACVLYEMLTGRPPFVADSPLAVVYQHLNQLPDPPSQVRPGVDPALDRVVLRALAKDPEARHPSAMAFADALTGAGAAEQPPPAVPPKHDETRRLDPETVAMAPVPGDQPRYRDTGRDERTAAATRRAIAAVVVVAVLVLLAVVVANTVDLGGGDPVVTGPPAEPPPTTEPATDEPTEPEPTPTPTPSPTPTPTPSPSPSPSPTDTATPSPTPDEASPTSDDGLPTPPTP